MSTASQEERSKCTRVAIKWEEQPMNPLLIVIDKTKPVTEIVSDIARQYNIERPEDYVLSKQPNPNDQIVTINEQNLHAVSEGTIMHLMRSPEHYVTDIMTKLSKDKETVLWNTALKDLHERYLMWPEFVYVYVTKQGHIQLLKLLKSGQCSASVPTICYQAGLHFNILMSIRVLFLKYGLPNSQNGHVSWQLMDDGVLTSLINGMRHGEVTSQTLECCYELLDNCIQQLPDKASWIVSEVTSEKIFYRLKNEAIQNLSEKFQSCLVNFLNTIFRRAKTDGRHREIVFSLLDTETRDILLKCINALREEAEVKNPFVESLVTLQQHLLCPSAIRASTAFDPSNEQQSFVKLIQTIVRPPNPRSSMILDSQSDLQTMSSLNLIRSLVSKNELSNRMSNWRFGPAEAAQFKALGFQNDTTPHLDFDVAHGGMLAFDCVMYFVQNYTKETEELLCGKASQDGEKVPFVHICTVVTRILAGRLRLIDDNARRGTPADETDFFPMLFCEDSPFEKIFCKCVTAFARTWRDMRATVADIEIVSKVFLQQLNYTFSERQFRQRLTRMMEGLQKNSYAEVVRRRRQREEEEKKSSILSEEIRRGIKPRINKLIVENRLRHMERGDNFQLAESTFFSSRAKDSKCLLLRLSPNHKELYYEMCSDEKTLWTTSSESDDDKPKISLASILCITYGGNCPHASNRKLAPVTASQCLSLTVSIPTDGGGEKPKAAINLCARNKDTFDVWMDGLNHLKEVAMRSSLHQREFEKLFDLEVKVRCLHLPPGLDVTQTPPVPPRPELLPPEMGH